MPAPGMLVKAMILIGYSNRARLNGVTKPWYVVSPSQLCDRLGLLQGDNGPIEVPGVPDDDVVVVVRGQTMVKPRIDADAINGSSEVASGWLPAARIKTRVFKL